MKLSVIINNFNYERYLGACIDSIIPQMEPEDEIIVVDDGSTDGSVDMLRRYGDRVRTIVQPNAGQAAAINTGVAAAAGDVLLLLDADDMFLGDKLATIRAAFARIGAKRPAFVTHRFTWIDRDGAARRRAAWALRDMLSKLRHLGGLHRVMNASGAVDMITRYGHIPWPCRTRTSAFCLNRAMADRVFPIPVQGERIYADEFVVRGCLFEGDFYCLERALTAYRDHGGNGWLHAAGKPADRSYNDRLNAYLTEKFQAAGGNGRIDPQDAVVTYIYAREDLSIVERCRRSWRRSPRDLRSLVYLALLVAKRTPYWLGGNALRRLYQA